MSEPAVHPLAPGRRDDDAATVARMADVLARRLVGEAREALRGMPLVEWGRHLLPAHFRLPSSRMHRWMGEQLDLMSERRGARLNVLGPRGGAKSTLATLCYVLRAAVELGEPYIWIVSDTADQARTHLANVRAELEGNWLLAAYYPQAVGEGPRCRRGELQLANGVCVEAYGTGQHLRGRRRRQHRPSLIVCDDLQNDQHMSSAAARQKSRDWFFGMLLKAGDGRTNVVNLATALHRDALALQLGRSPGWTSRVFRAIERWPERLDLWSQWQELYADADDPAAHDNAGAFFDEHRAEMLTGAELLWPEHEDLYGLMRMRVEEGRTAFEREKQNSPIDPELCEWPEDYFGPHVWFDKWPDDLVVKVVALDPSKGADARHGDYSAYVLLGRDAQGVWYVEADLARRPTPEMVETGVLICKRFNPHAFGVEANQFQDLLGAEFKEAFRRRHARQLMPHLIANYTNKRVRIRTLGPLLARRELRFRTRSPGTQLVVDQLRDFPLGAHDDGPDALEMAVRLANTLLGGAEFDDGLGERLIAES